MVDIHRCLEENSFNVDLTVGAIIAENARKEGKSTYLKNDQCTRNKV